MKAFSPFLFATLLFPLTAFSQDEATVESEETSTETAPVVVDEVAEQSARRFQEEFSNLPEEQRKAYVEHLTQAGNYFRQKRIFECMDEIHKAQQIIEDGPNAINMLGACYVEFRYFDKAREAFKKSLSLAPKNPSVLFNLAEIEFVTKNWGKCIERMDEVLAVLPEDASQMRELVIYKKLLCHIKLGNLEKAQELSSTYTDADDSPFAYYAKAALLFNSDDSLAADRELAKARRIYTLNPQLIAPWDDTLIEFGYLQSFFGSLDEELAQ